MKKKAFLISISLFIGVLFSVLVSRGSDNQSKKPNVLLIYTDDHAQWALGAYGNKDIYTPNMDRFASEGMRFTQGFTKPVCSPSRAMLMTGRYSHRLGIPDYIPFGNPIHIDNGLPPGTTTIASLLKKAGYTTALLGKWHLGYGEKYYPQNYGFDIAEGYRYLARGKKFDTPGRLPYLIDGIEDNNFGKSSDPVSDCTTILADKAIRFIKEDREEPFFLYLSFYRPHLAWEPVPNQDLAHYLDKPVDVPPPPQNSSVSKEKLQELTRLYYANVTCVDRNMGRVLGALEEQGITEETVVIFIGDNGFMVGHHGLLGKGNARILHVSDQGRISREKGTRANMFDESVLVPFMIRWPGVVAPGATSDALVSTIDILPTIASIIGVHSPVKIDGMNLLPLLKGESSAPRRDSYSDTYDMIYLGDNGEKPHMRMFRTDNWKLVLYMDENGQALDGGSRHELFCLEDDPGEKHNLYGNERVAEIQESLENKLRIWMIENELAR